MVKVIASDVRKGNVLEHEDGKLYVVMSHETFRPGKGTPTTTIVMRRIVDGVKTTVTHKTTDGLEKAFVEEVKHTFLFDDGDAGLVFMNPVNYEQVHADARHGRRCRRLPRAGNGSASDHVRGPGALHRIAAAGDATIESTEPVVKGQTASSSYKPAMLSNGVKTMVPPHIGPGTRVVVSTEDGSYVERAKD